MIDHYNAFISYKHAPEDTKVAEAIQRGLEHFHIPGSIQKKTGMKRIERIFRDKDELPITSNLSDTIANALEQSEYLIVICSTRTKQSIWVTREIEYFLRTHTKDKILTVLVDGEPQDVIPPELLYEDRYYYDQNGQPRIFRTNVEPLSGDYRMSLNKANKTELPRLASALIGCSYDELMNRRRQYKLRRLVLGFSGILLALLMFSAYMMYSRHLLRKTYMESLKNQSRYLANESQKYLDDEDRITAIQLALAALPKNAKDDRPITPEAVKALTNATLAYQSQRGSNIETEWSYNMPTEVSDFAISPDHTTLTASDTNDNLVVWNTETHEKIYEEPIKGSTLCSFKYIDDTRLLTCTTNNLKLIDLTDGSTIWNYYDNNEILSGYDMLLTNDGCVYIENSDGEFIKISLENGKKADSIKVIESDSDMSIMSAYISPDASRIAILYSTLDDVRFLRVYDTKTKEYIELNLENYYCRTVSFTDNEHLMLAESDIFQEGSSSFNTTTIYEPETTIVKCLNAADLKEEWSAEFETTDVIIKNDFLYLPETDSISYFCGNRASIYDLKSGEEKYTYDLNSPIIDSSDRDGDGWPIYITENGVLGSPSPNSGSRSINGVNYFCDDIDIASVNNGVYVKKFFSRQILYYGIEVYDENWKELNSDVVLPTSYNQSLVSDKDIAVITDSADSGSSGEAGNALLLIYDIENDYKLHQTELEDTKYRYSLLENIGDNQYFIHYGTDTNTLKCINVKSGEVSEVETFGNIYSEKMENGKFTYLTNKDNKTIINIYDIATGKTRELETPEENGYPTAASIFPFEENETIYYPGEVEYLVNTKSKDFTEVETPTGWTITSLVAKSQDGESYCITDSSNIAVINPDGKVQYTIKGTGRSVTGISFVIDKNGNELILAVYSDGAIYRYSKEDGSFLGQTDITYMYGGSGSARFHMLDDNATMLIQTDELTSIVDTSSWIETGYVESCLGYSERTDCFYTYSYITSSETHIGYFKRYNVDQLISKAKDILQGSELSDELKTQYGLEE